MFNYEEMKNKIIHADCMDIMKDIPDKYFELAIVDPPYGIGGGLKGGRPFSMLNGEKWDNAPDESYFKELKKMMVVIFQNVNLRGLLLNVHQEYLKKDL
jgi:DNA modification methylase